MGRRGRLRPPALRQSDCGLSRFGPRPAGRTRGRSDVAQPELTFSAAVDRYIAHKRANWKPGSFAQINHHLNNQAKPLHKLVLPEVTRLRVANLLDEIEKNLDQLPATELAQVSSPSSNG